MIFVALSWPMGFFILFSPYPVEEGSERAAVCVSYSWPVSTLHLIVKQCHKSYILHLILNFGAFFFLTFLIDIHHKTQLHSNSATSSSSFSPVVVLLWNSVPVNAHTGKFSTSFSGGSGFKLACLEMDAKFDLTCRGVSEEDYFLVWNCSKECFVAIPCEIQFAF